MEPAHPNQPTTAPSSTELGPILSLVFAARILQPPIPHEPVDVGSRLADDVLVVLGRHVHLLDTHAVLQLLGPGGDPLAGLLHILLRTFDLHLAGAGVELDVHLQTARARFSSACSGNFVLND